MTKTALRTQPSFVHVIRLMAIIASHRRLLVRRRQMAFLTGRYRMQPDERETSEVMIEKHLRPPALLVMTSLTLLSFLSPMNVIRLMAPVAAGAQLVPLLACGVTKLALQCGVRAAQRKLGVLAVIECHTVPSGLLVALTAVLPETAAMFVVHLVTAEAVARQRFLEDHSFMADLTAHASMLSTQGEIGIFVVIELDTQPSRGCMAALALSAVTTPMLIVLSVAIEALASPRIVLEVAAVARAAVSPAMRPHERKSRVLVMIEHHFPPALRDMTLFALGPMPALMHVVQAVTGIAGRRGLLVTLVHMTEIACHLAMHAHQREFRLVVVEFRLSPIRLSMTSLALLAKSSLV